MIRFRPKTQDEKSTPAARPSPLPMDFAATAILPRAKKPRTAKSAKTIEIVCIDVANLDADKALNVGIDVDEHAIHAILSTRYRNVAITRIGSQDDLDRLAARDPDLVFSGIKFFYLDGKEVWLNDFLDLNNIAYIASSHAVLDSEYDKASAKRIMQYAGVATAGFFITGPDEHTDAEALPLEFPLFIKPLVGGDSIGVDASSLAHDFAGFRRKVQDIHDEQESRSLVERYLSGREFSVGLLESEDGTLQALPIEIIAMPNRNGDRILDYDMKKQNLESVVAVTDVVIRERLQDLAKAAFRALHGRAFGRIDVKMDDLGTLHFIEANLMPGLRHGYFYRACKLNLQMSYKEMILTIASNGLRSGDIADLVTPITENASDLGSMAAH